MSVRQEGMASASLQHGAQTALVCALALAAHKQLYSKDLAQAQAVEKRIRGQLDATGDVLESLLSDQLVVRIR